MKKIVFMVALIFISIYSIATNFYVYNGQVIQSTIDSSTNGDTIFVRGYHEENITVNKSISIIGLKNKSVIDGIIKITSDNVSILNITTNGIIIEGNNCKISNNFISENGIIINGSNNTICNNFIQNCSKGIFLNGDNNTIFQNDFSFNYYGIYSNGNKNLIYHNNFIKNTKNAIDNGKNLWNLSYPREGNYWHDYTGNDTNNDSIGDTPYIINGSKDNYPLINPYDVYPPYTNYSIIILSGNIGNNGWYIGNVSLSLIPHDDSNIKYTKYRINGGEWNYYNTSLNFTQDGIYIIEFYSVDDKGNIEEIRNVTIKIDKTLPQLYYNVFPSSPNGKNGWYNSSVEISLNAIDENLDAIYYKIDNGTWQPYEGYPLIPDGIHKIYFKAIDYAGNYVIKNTSLKKDTHPPVINIVKPDGGYVKQVYEIKYNVSDEIDKNLNGSISIFYSPNNGSNWEEIVEGINNTGKYEWNSFPFDDSSQAIIKIIAIDDAGNVGMATSKLFILDNTPPNVIITSPKNGQVFGKNITIDIDWEAYDDIDKDLNGSIYISYLFNNTWYPIANRTLNNGEYSIQTIGWRDGNYKIRVMAIDDAGNIGIYMTENITIDKTDPFVYISRPLRGYIYINILGRPMLPPLPIVGLPYDVIIIGEIEVDIEASDSCSGVQEVIISSEGASVPLYSEPYKWEWDPTLGTHYLKATAYDNAGNFNSYEIDNILCINI